MKIFTDQVDQQITYYGPGEVCQCTLIRISPGTLSFFYYQHWLFEDSQHNYDYKLAYLYQFQVYEQFKMLKTYRSLRTLYTVHVRHTLFQSPHKSLPFCQIALRSTSTNMSEIDGNTVLAQSLKKQVCITLFWMLSFIVPYLNLTSVRVHIKCTNEKCQRERM